MDNDILTQERQFYTYTHTRNDTGAVFYVGKGSGNRCYSKSGRNTHWKRIVAKHGYTVHLARTNLTEQDAFEHEKLLIICFKDIGVPLTNCTNGGEGPSGLVHTPETRARISEKLSALQIGNTRGKGNKGRVRTPEFIAKMSSTKTGIKLKHTDEWLLRQRNGDKFHHSEETKEKMSVDRIGNQHARGHKDTPEQREKKSIAQIKRNAGINSTAKLSEKDVLDIRCSTARPKKIATEYGVSDTLIYRIIQRKAWSHVP